MDAARNGWCGQGRVHRLGGSWHYSMEGPTRTTAPPRTTRKEVWMVTATVSMRQLALRTSTSALLLMGLCVWPGSANSQEVRRDWLAEPILSATITDRQGDLFGDPWWLIGDPGGGFIIAEAATIHAFNVDGTRRWSAGRPGQGPGEFSVIEDVKVAPDGRVLTLDREQPRVTVFDRATGEFVATVLLRREVAMTRRILPAQGALARVEVGLPGEEGTTWWTVSEKGEIVDEARGPSSCSQSLTCESRVASDLGWSGVQAYRWSSQLVFHDSDGTTRVVEGIDSIPSPQTVSYTLDASRIEGIRALRATRVDPEAPEVVKSAATDGSQAVLLMMTGDSEDRRRISTAWQMAHTWGRGGFRRVSGPSHSCRTGALPHCARCCFPRSRSGSFHDAHSVLLQGASIAVGIARRFSRMR